jgi:hypothetical protein
MDYHLDISHMTCDAHTMFVRGVTKISLSPDVGEVQVRHICFLYHFKSVQFCAHRTLYTQCVLYAQNFKALHYTSIKGAQIIVADTKIIILRV